MGVLIFYIFWVMGLRALAAAVLVRILVSGGAGVGRFAPLHLLGGKVYWMGKGRGKCTTYW